MNSAYHSLQNGGGRGAITERLPEGANPPKAKAMLGAVGALMTGAYFPSAALKM